MSQRPKVLAYEPAADAGSWLSRLGRSGRPDTAGGTPEEDLVRAPDYDVRDMHAVVEKLRGEAIRRAREDARAQRDGVHQDLPLATAETELRERARSVFERWRAHERASVEAAWADQEKSLSEKMGRAALLIDRIQRLAHELKRTKARLSLRKQEVARELQRNGSDGARGLSSRAYVLAVAFLPDCKTLVSASADETVRLWDLVLGWREFPHVYELQRPKRPEDIAAIATAFRPYLEARDWITIQKETP